MKTLEERTFDRFLNEICKRLPWGVRKPQGAFKTEIELAIRDGIEAALKAQECQRGGKP